MPVTSYGSVPGDFSDLESAVADNNNSAQTDSPRLERNNSGKAYIVGVVLSLISGFMFTANNFLINQTSLIVSDLVLVRTTIQVVVCTVLVSSKGELFLPSSSMKKFYTITQGLTGAIAVISSLASVSFMAVPDALCIIFACPVVTIILSALLLRDKITLVKILAGSLLVIGVIFVCKPPFIFINFSPRTVEKDDLYYVGVFLAVTACLAGGLMDVLVAKCEEVSAFVLLLWTAISGLAISIIYCVATPQSAILSPDILHITWHHWALYLGLALSGLLAFATLTKSLQLISPNLVASLRTLELVLAFLVQSILTGVSPSLSSCLGGGAILTGVLLLAFQDSILQASRHLATLIKEYLRSLSHSHYWAEGEERRLLRGQSVVSTQTPPVVATAITLTYRSYQCGRTSQASQ